MTWKKLLKQLKRHIKFEIFQLPCKAVYTYDPSLMEVYILLIDKDSHKFEDCERRTWFKNHKTVFHWKLAKITLALFESSYNVID